MAITEYESVGQSQAVRASLAAHWQTASSPLPKPRALPPDKQPANLHLINWPIMLLMNECRPLQGRFI
jgi:hypothetical protein